MVNLDRFLRDTTVRLVSIWRGESAIDVAPWINLRLPTYVILLYVYTCINPLTGPLFDSSEGVRSINGSFQFYKSDGLNTKLAPFSRNVALHFFAVISFETLRSLEPLNYNFRRKRSRKRNKNNGSLVNGLTRWSNRYFIRNIYVNAHRFIV